MNEPDNYELLIFSIKTIVICGGVFILLRWLFSKLKEWPDKFTEKRKLLEAEYSTCSTDDLLQVLNKINNKPTVHKSAIFQVLSDRVDDARIIERVQQLQGAFDPLIRMNSNYVMTHYHEKQYTDYRTEDLLDLLQHLEERNEQEVHALLMVALTRIEDKRVQRCIYEILHSTDRKARFNAEFLIKGYFEKQTADDTINDLLDLLQTLENRNKQEIAVILTITAARMQDQRVNLCIGQLQNSKNRLVREKARQIMKDYMA
jgi:hypothetical protein